MCFNECTFVFSFKKESFSKRKGSALKNITKKRISLIIILCGMIMIPLGGGSSMFKMKSTDLFKCVAKKMITQELQAQKKYNDIQNDINEHKKLMSDRRKSFKFIQNK